STPSAFFFQAEDGIRDGHVTGVQTCALPISSKPATADADPSGCAGPPASFRQRYRQTPTTRRCLAPPGPAESSPCADDEASAPPSPDSSTAAMAAAPSTFLPPRFRSASATDWLASRSPSVEWDAPHESGQY